MCLKLAPLFIAPNPCYFSMVIRCPKFEVWAALPNDVTYMAFSWNLLFSNLSFLFGTRRCRNAFHVQWGYPFRFRDIFLNFFRCMCTSNSSRCSFFRGICWSSNLNKYISITFWVTIVAVGFVLLWNNFRIYLSVAIFMELFRLK